jgi:UDP-N-acetylmuramoyl-tripeptide--D-alanyl-D-alanine ligase
VGKDSQLEHQKVAELISGSSVREACLIGENFYKVALSDDKVRKFKSFEDFGTYIKTRSFEDTTFLIKASRGMALERVLDLL